MVLLYFSYLIIVVNILILSVGYVANIAFIGFFLGGLMAIGTDPIILILGALLGAGLVTKPYKFSVVYLWIGAMFLTMLVHVILGTTRVIVDVVKFSRHYFGVLFDIFIKILCHLNNQWSKKTCNNNYECRNY